MPDNNTPINHPYDPEAEQSYQAAIGILADIVLAYLTPKKAKERYHRSSGGFGSTGPVNDNPIAA